MKPNLLIAIKLLLLLKFTDEKFSIVMLRNETTTKRHETHRTLTKKWWGEGDKSKGWPEATDNSKIHIKVLSTSRLTQVYNY